MLLDRSKRRDIPVEIKLEIVKHYKSGEYLYQLEKETGFQRKQIKYWAKNEDSNISISKNKNVRGLAALAHKPNLRKLKSICLSGSKMKESTSTKSTTLGCKRRYKKLYKNFKLSTFLALTSGFLISVIVTILEIAELHIKGSRMDVLQWKSIKL